MPVIDPYIAGERKEERETDFLKTIEISIGYNKVLSQHLSTLGPSHGHLTAISRATCDVLKEAVYFGYILWR